MCCEATERSQSGVLKFVGIEDHREETAFSRMGIVKAKVVRNQWKITQFTKDKPTRY